VNVVDREMAISTPATIEYSSKAKIALVTLLHLAELYLITLLVHVNEPFVPSSIPRVIIYPIYELKSWLLANKPSINIKSLARGKGRAINHSPRS